jgi:hypothetical protein
MGLQLSSRRLYLPARGLTTALALGFALFYSRELGVVNRGYLAAIMTFTILTLVLFTSGTTLTLRNLSAKGDFLPSFFAFKSLIIIECFFALILFVFEILLFSILKNSIPVPLFFVSIVYFIASAMHLISLEILIALNLFKEASKFEIFTVLSQISFYIFFTKVTPFSTAIGLLLSFAISGAMISTVILIRHRSALGDWKSFSPPLKFLKKTQGNHLIGAVQGIIDVSDRIIITWLLPVAYLAQYSVMSSFISFFRFAPDAYSKIIVSQKKEKYITLFTKSYLIFGSIILASMFMVIASRFSITHLLGPDWILPWGVSILFAIQELVRGSFQVSGAMRISLGNSTIVNRASLGLAAVGIPVSVFTTSLFGIYGVPLGFISTYVVLIFIMNHGRVSRDA